MPIRATCRGSMPGGEQWVNVLHFAGSSIDAPTAAGLQERLEAFYGGLTDQFANAWSFDGVDYAVVGEGTEFSLPVDPVIQGEGGTIPMPNDCAIVITWLTDTNNRTGRGRTFLGGFTVAVLGADPTSGAGVMSAGSAGDIALEAVSLADGDPALVVLSRKLAIGRPVTGGYVGNRFDTMRRRDLGVPETRTVFTV